jgi:hypothetical protein
MAVDAKIRRKERAATKFQKPTSSAPNSTVPVENNSTGELLCEHCMSLLSSKHSKMNTEISSVPDSLRAHVLRSQMRMQISDCILSDSDVESS